MFKKTWELRWKIAFTFLVGIPIYRLGLKIPVPGIVPELLVKTGETQLSQFMSTITAVQLGKFNFFGLGLMPQITAGLLMMSMGLAFPKIKEWQKGRAGGKKQQKWTGGLILLICVISSFWSLKTGYQEGTLLEFCGNPNDFVQHLFIPAFTLTTGGMLLYWLGNKMTRHGISNGTSVIISVNIISGLWKQYTHSSLLMLPVMLIAFVTTTVLVLRYLPAKKKIIFRDGTGTDFTVKHAALYPLFMVGAVIAIAASFGWKSIPGTITAIFYALVAYIISILWRKIQFNPQVIARSWQEQGLRVTGISQGSRTENFVRRLLKTVARTEATMLALIAVIALPAGGVGFVMVLFTAGEITSKKSIMGN